MHHEPSTPSVPTPRPGRHFRHLLLLCASLPAWGCVTLGELQTADTVGAGRSRWNVHGKAQYHGGDDVAPEASVGYQYGVTDSVDLGLRLFTAGAEVSGKVMLSPRDARTLVSLAPSVGGRFQGVEDYRTLHVALPVLMGLVGDNGSQWVLGLRPSLRRTWGSFPPSVSNQYWVGTSVGYAFRVGERVKLMPELALAAPLPTERTAFRPVAQLGFAVMLDGGSGP
jgi:hypothetical protein